MKQIPNFSFQMKDDRSTLDDEEDIYFRWSMSPQDDQSTWIIAPCGDPIPVL